MTVSIVVARYNEDVEWSKQFKNVTIYNKGVELDGSYNEIMLENVGREGHTYYKHICDNYEQLSDYIIFLQGNPFDHSPNLIQNINNYIDDPELNIEFGYLSEWIVDCNLTGCLHHGGLPLIDVYEKLFNERKEELGFQFGAGAQFIVSKQVVLKKPKEFYHKIVQLLENDISPIEGYVIERFHRLIFT